MKLTFANGDIAEGTVDEILGFYNRRDQKALPGAIANISFSPLAGRKRTPDEKGIFPCSQCNHAPFDTRRGLNRHITMLHKTQDKIGDRLLAGNERQRIIQRAALADKENGVAR